MLRGELKATCTSQPAPPAPCTPLAQAATHQSAGCTGRCSLSSKVESRSNTTATWRAAMVRAMKATPSTCK